MLAYDYLKQNPQQNAKRIQCGWRELFGDSDCPNGVKQELIELDVLTDDISDAVLYFHKIYAYHKFTAFTTLPVKHSASMYDQLFSTIVGHKKFIDTLYSYVQLYPMQEDNVADIFKDILYDIHMKYLLDLCDDITSKELNQCISLYCNISNFNFNTLGIVDTIRRNHFGMDSSKVTFNIGGLCDLLEYMDIDFIRTAERSTVHAVFDLIRDTPKPIGAKYKSVGEIERAHDAKTEETVQKMLKKSPAKIIYVPEFEKIVNDSEYFKLPESRNDMILRGARHHNCVATYADRHLRTQFIEGISMTRILFAPDATAELDIYIEHKLIVAVQCPQYKGAYNKDIPKPLALTKLRIALTGLPARVLDVKEQNDDKDQTF